MPHESLTCNQTLRNPDSTRTPERRLPREPPCPTVQQVPLIQPYRWNPTRLSTRANLPSHAAAREPTPALLTAQRHAPRNNLCLRWKTTYSTPPPAPAHGFIDWSLFFTAPRHKHQDPKLPPAYNSLLANVPYHALANPFIPLHPAGVR